MASSSPVSSCRCSTRSRPSRRGPCRCAGVGAGQGVHHIDYEGAETAARLRVDKLVLEGNVAVFDDVVGQVRRDDDEGSSVVGVPYGGDDAFYGMLADHTNDVVIEAGPDLALLSRLVAESGMDLRKLTPYRCERGGEPARVEYVHRGIRESAFFQLAERFQPNVDGDASRTVYPEDQNRRQRRRDIPTPLSSPQPSWSRVDEAPDSQPHFLVETDPDERAVVVGGG